MRYNIWVDDKTLEQYVNNEIDFIDSDGKSVKVNSLIELLENITIKVYEKSMTQSPFGTQKIYASEVKEIIDNQIKQLKEGK